MLEDWTWFIWSDVYCPHSPEHNGKQKMSQQTNLLNGFLLLSLSIVYIWVLSEK